METIVSSFTIVMTRIVYIKVFLEQALRSQVLSNPMGAKSGILVAVGAED